VGNKIKCLKKLRETKKKHLIIVGNKKSKISGKIIFFAKKKRLAAVLTGAKSPKQRGIKLQIATLSNCRKNQLNRR
jgi:hypothetical protein